MGHRSYLRRWEQSWFQKWYSYSIVSMDIILLLLLGKMIKQSVLTSWIEEYQQLKQENDFGFSFWAINTFELVFPKSYHPSAFFFFFLLVLFQSSS